MVVSLGVPILRVFTVIIALLQIRQFGSKKVKVSHSLMTVGAVGVRVALFLGHSR